jgi:phosphoribosylformylglycinamidine synthase
MVWRIDVFPKKEEPSSELISQIKDLGISKDFEVLFRQIYFIEADLEEKEINKIASQLLIDPVIENYSLKKEAGERKPSFNEIVITYNPGVCDPVSISLAKAIEDLSLEVKNTRTARFYKFSGLEKEEIDYIAPKILYNPLIEHILDYEKVAGMDTLEEFSGVGYTFRLKTINLLDADDQRLKEISQDGCLSLSLEEMRIIKGYFKERGRNPTDCELETIAVLWSEHCAHKTFRGIIDYEERDEKFNVIKKERIDNLLKSTIIKATEEINSSDCVSVFYDNSGVVKFDKDFNICFKVETHNHPSSLEPYGGSSTGIGGVIRDILGTGCAARPFASIDVFCFSPWEISYDDLPKGLLHPKRIIKGVVRGVRDYGNRMGIPTVAGAVLFDERFLGNPLVYCGTLGIISNRRVFKKANKGDLIIVAGARTGRDGIHGATFSSQELDESTVSLKSAVQIGNPIEEKKLTEAILRAAEEDLFSAITDCGAGGLSSAVTELAREQGAEVYLEKVPLKYKGLSYTEIWISESQERMVLFSKEGNLGRLKEIFKEEDVELNVIGKVTDSKRLVLFYGGNKVADLDMNFIFELPKLNKKALWILKKEKDFKLKEKNSYNRDLKLLLSSPNVAPKDWILREYDHEVRGGSVVKSIFGIEKIGVCDAAVVRPNLDSNKCVVIGVGINPFYSDVDPYWMAALSVDEALRNVVSVGARLDKTFILDNFSWGSPEDKNILGGLVRASRACYDFATYFGTPFISGKDSLYNEYFVNDKRIAIPGTLLISAMSIIDDWRKVLTSNFKREGNLIYLLGLTKPHLGGSEYFRRLQINKDALKGLLPKVDRSIAKDVFFGLREVIDKNLAVSVHDLSEGGLGVAISEMCMASNWGASVFLQEVPHEENMLDYEVLFSESPTRFLIEVDKNKKGDFEKTLGGLPLGLIGCVSQDKKLVIYNKAGKEVINVNVEELRKTWLSPFKEFRQNESKSTNY